MYQQAMKKDSLPTRRQVLIGSFEDSESHGKSPTMETDEKSGMEIEGDKLPTAEIDQKSSTMEPGVKLLTTEISADKPPIAETENISALIEIEDEPSTMEARDLLSMIEVDNMSPTLETENSLESLTTKIDCDKSLAEDDESPVMETKGNASVDDKSTMILTEIGDDKSQIRTKDIVEMIDKAATSLPMTEADNVSPVIEADEKRYVIETNGNLSMIVAQDNQPTPELDNNLSTTEPNTNNLSATEADSLSTTEPDGNLSTRETESNSPVIDESPITCTMETTLGKSPVMETLNNSPSTETNDSRSLAVVETDSVSLTGDDDDNTSSEEPSLHVQLLNKYGSPTRIALFLMFAAGYIDMQHFVENTQLDDWQSSDESEEEHESIQYHHANHIHLSTEEERDN